jgi:hypothetical protein
MKFEPLATHRQRFRVGEPIPYAIFDAGGRLLLARGHTIPNEDQFENLLDREAKVDLSKMDATPEKIAKARPEQLPSYWNDSIDAVSRLLRANPGPDFVYALDQASRPLMSLIQKDPDQAILQVVRIDHLGDQTL